MKRLLFLLILCVGCIGGYAQTNGRKHHLSKEEFQSRQCGFIVKFAKLTKDESDYFIPLFIELQNKKDELNEQHWKKIRGQKMDNLSEDECEKLTLAMLDARVKVAELEKGYYKKFRKKISAKSLLRVQQAEMAFHKYMLTMRGDKGKPNQDSHKKK